MISYPGVDPKVSVLCLRLWPAEPWRSFSELVPWTMQAGGGIQAVGVIIVSKYDTLFRQDLLRLYSCKAVFILPEALNRVNQLGKTSLLLKLSGKN